MKEKPKPCDECCPKCGNADVYCEWVPCGKKIVPPNYKTTTGNVVVYDVDEVSAPHDRLRHHCRVCRYEWDTKPKE